MQYVYPKLSSMDLNVTRIGGLGLGNMLFTYARALLYARDHAAVMIWPTWNSIPVGQILRREENKRYYHDLFTPKKPENDIEGKAEVPAICFGCRKIWLRCTRKKIQEKELQENQKNFSEKECDEKIIEFTGMEEEFEPIYGRENSQYILKHLQHILQEQNRAALQFHPGKAICMHVRLGDFGKASSEEQKEVVEEMQEEALKKGLPNLRIPITWYCEVVDQIRKEAGAEIPVYVFSDGTDEELRPLLELPEVCRKTFGTAIADIMAMAQSKVFVASGSTFSRWVRYLGRMDTIAYPGQLKQKVLEETEEAVEEEAEVIPKKVLEHIVAVLSMQGYEDGQR